MSSTLTRRSALAGIATATIATPAIANPSTGIGFLWEQRQVYVDRARSLGAEWNAAFASIPTWARPGPRLINNRGEYCGDVCGWPLDASVQPPESSFAFRVCRVSPRDITERMEFNSRHFPARRAIYRQAWRERMRKLIPLLRAKRAEYKRAGIAEIEARLGAVSERFDVDQAIRNLDPALDVTAAMLLIELTDACLMTDSCEESSAMQMAAMALEALQPHLTGMVAEHVAFYLQHRDIPLSQMPFCGG